jgi:hypothetical protein
MERVEYQSLLGSPLGPEHPSLDQPCVPAADTACYLLDDFQRTLTAGTYSNSGDGGVWGGVTQYQAEGNDGTPWEMHVSPVWAKVASSVGRAAHGWTSNPGLGCGGLDFTFTGWFEREVWYKYTVPEHPSDLAGILFGPVTYTGSTGLAGGTVGIDNPGWLRYSATEPEGLRAGQVIGILSSGVAETVYIPSDLIPDEAGEIWIGVGPGWTADYGDATCGFRWPWMSGQANSGVGNASLNDTMIWQSWDAGADDWGTAMSDDDSGAWWEGNLPWSVTASSPGTYGIDGSNLYLSVASGSTETLAAFMAGASEARVADDNDDPLGEPWTHELGVSMRARFRITTAGSITEAGDRFLHFKWNDGRDELTVTVHLGDTTFAEGISISDSDQTASADKAITEGSWMWVRFDSRNPTYLHGKMWVEGGAKGSGEPPAWDIELTREDDSEFPVSADNFEVVLSAGNATGATQTIEVGEIWFCGPGDDCEWVTEKIGEGDGQTMVLQTSQPYKTGGLWFFSDGHHVQTTPVSKAQGTFYAGGVPSADGVDLTARYLVDRNPSGD